MSKDLGVFSSSPMKKFAFDFWAKCVRDGFSILGEGHQKEKAWAHIIEHTNINYETVQRWFKEFERMWEAQHTQVEAQK